jgi:hypothetical protein
MSAYLRRVSAFCFSLNGFHSVLGCLARCIGLVKESVQFPPAGSGSGVYPDLYSSIVSLEDLLRVDLED